jgi:hypothetical protein
LAIDWARGSFGCENLKTPFITSVTSLKFLERREEYVAVFQRGKTDLEEFLY